MKKNCKWLKVYVGYYNTDCGHTWFEDDEIPVYKFNYCPYCGGKLKLIYDENSED